MLYQPFVGDLSTFDVIFSIAFRDSGILSFVIILLFSFQYSLSAFSFLFALPIVVCPICSFLHFFSFYFSPNPLNFPLKKFCIVYKVPKTFLCLISLRLDFLFLFVVCDFLNVLPNQFCLPILDLLAVLPLFCSPMLRYLPIFCQTPG